MEIKWWHWRWWVHRRWAEWGLSPGVADAAPLPAPIVHLLRLNFKHKLFYHFEDLIVTSVKVVVATRCSPGQLEIEGFLFLQSKLEIRNPVWRADVS